MAAITKEKAVLTSFTDSTTSTPRLNAVNARLVRRQGILAQLCIRCGGYSGSDNEYCMRCRGSQWRTNPHVRNYDEVYRIYMEENKTKLKNMEKLGDPEGWLIMNEQRTKQERKDKRKKYLERLSIQHKGEYCVECHRSEKQSTVNLCLICDAKRRRRERDKREKIDKPFQCDDLTPRMRKKKRQVEALLEVVPDNLVVATETQQVDDTDEEEQTDT